MEILNEQLVSAHCAAAFEHEFDGAADVIVEKLFKRFEGRGQFAGQLHENVAGPDHRCMQEPEQQQQHVAAKIDRAGMG